MTFEYSIELLTDRLNSLRSKIDDIEDRIDFELEEENAFNDDLEMERVNAQDEYNDIAAAIDLLRKKSEENTAAKILKEK